jgi:hypothetical protein
MKTFQNTLLLAVLLLLTSCASKYYKINPETENYISKSSENNITLEYKYNTLGKKYSKKELQNGVKTVSVKITNNSEKDIVLGTDFRFTYENGDGVTLLDANYIFKTLKQSPASYLWYLLLSPLQLYSGTKTTQNGSYVITEPKSSFPIGLILGPGIALGNMIAAGDANNNFKNDLTEFDLINKTIRKGETVYGIIGIRSNQYDSIKIKTLN